MLREIAKEKDRFVVVGWPECQYFMDGQHAIHLAGAHNSYLQFGDSAYFVPVGHYQQVAGHPPYQHDTVYLAVPFPESQLFMDGHRDEIHLISGEEGIGEYGNAAYFVEEGLYKMVVAGFEKEVATISLSGGLDHN